MAFAEVIEGKWFLVVSKMIVSNEDYDVYIV